MSDEPQIKNEATANRVQRSRFTVHYSAFLVPLAIFLLSRAVIFTVTGFSLVADQHFHNYQAPVAGNLIVQGLTRWDGGWFIQIAREGYPHRQPPSSEPAAQAQRREELKRTNFFPLFPLMGRYFSMVTGLSIPVSLVICANLCALAALIVVYRIFLELEGPAGAMAAMGLLVAWPFSFFQAAAYPESIMMLSTALAIWLAMRQRHWAAGTALGIGILARHLTALGGLSLLAQHIKERGWYPRRLIRHRDFLGLLVPLAIAAIYPIFLAIRLGQPLIWLRMRSQWGNLSWAGVYSFFMRSDVHQYPEIVFYIIISIFPSLGAFLLLTRRRWLVPAAFGLGLMLLLWCTGAAGLGRYGGSCWPAFLPLGVILARRPAILVGLLCTFAMLQGMMLYLFVHLFPIL